MIARTGRARIAVSIAAFVLTQNCDAAEFFALGDFPEGQFASTANAITSDGTIVVGAGSRYLDAPDMSDAMRWSEVDGIQSLQTLPAGESPQTIAKGVSDDARVIVGRMHYWSTQPSDQAFRWTAGGGMEGLGYLQDAPPLRSSAEDVSADGKVIVGFSNSSNGPIEAFRWTEGVGMTGLGDLAGGGFFSEALGVSADGAIVVGEAVSENGSEAFRWTESTGMVGLGDLAGRFLGSRATAISSDGKTIVGIGVPELSGSTVEGFRWTESQGMIGLGDLPGGSISSEVLAVNANGSVVIGASRRADGFTAFVWDEVHGMRDLNDVLIDEFALGMQLSGWQLTVAADISDDGQSIVGTGINPMGETEAWLVRLDRPITAPEPGAITLLVVATGWTLAFARRRLIENRVSLQTVTTAVCAPHFAPSLTSATGRNLDTAEQHDSAS